MTDKALPELAPQSPKPQGLNSTHGMGTSLHIYTFKAKQTLRMHGVSASDSLHP